MTKVRFNEEILKMKFEDIYNRYSQKEIDTQIIMPPIKWNTWLRRDSSPHKDKKGRINEKRNEKETP